MGRRPRVHFAGAIYHVVDRGVDRRVIFIDDCDRAAFLDSLRAVAKNSSAEILAYCLMGNHFHFAIKVGPVPLAIIMQRFLAGYARSFNHRHGRSGHLFEARYGAYLCESESYLTALIRYIHMNPVRAGLVERPEDWPWSSLFGKKMPLDSEGIPKDFDPWHAGGVENVSLQREAEMNPKTLDELGDLFAAKTGVNLLDLRSDERRRKVIEAKRALVQEAVRNGHKLITIAKWMNAAHSSISRYARAKHCNLEGLTPNI